MPFFIGGQPFDYDNTPTAASAASGTTTINSKTAQTLGHLDIMSGLEDPDDWEPEQAFNFLKKTCVQIADGDAGKASAIYKQITTGFVESNDTLNLLEDEEDDNEEDEVQRWVEEFAGTFLQKEGEKKSAKELFHASTKIENSEDAELTSGGEFYTRDYQLAVVSKTQLIYGIEKPSTTQEKKQAYVHKLMGSAIMVSGLTNNPILGVLLPVSKEYVEKQYSLLSSNKYQLPKFSGQGQSSLLSVLLNYANERHKKWVDALTMDIQQGLNWKNEHPKDSDCNAAAVFHLKTMQPVAFDSPKGPRTDAVHVITHFIQCWILDPNRSRIESFKSTYAELMKVQPKNQVTLNHIVNKRIHSIKVNDLERTILQHADKAVLVEDMLAEGKPTVQTVSEDHCSEFREAIKEYIKVTKDTYAIPWSNSKAYGPDPLPAFQNFLATDAPLDLKEKFQPLMKLKPTLCEDYKNWYQKNVAKKSKSDIQAERKRKAAEKKAKRSESMAKKSKIDADEAKQKALLRTKEQQKKAKKLHSLLEDEDYKKIDRNYKIIDVNHLGFSNISESDRPPMTIHPKPQDFPEAQFPDGFNFGAYHKVKKSSVLGGVTDLVFSPPGDNWSKHMTTCFLKIMWCIDVTCLKSAKADEHLNALPEDDDQVTEIWLALWKFVMGGRLDIDKITDLDDFKTYSLGCLTTFLREGYHGKRYVRAFQLFHYYVMGPQVGEAQDTADQKNNLKILINAASNEGKFKQVDTDLTVSLIAMLIRVKSIYDGTHDDWEKTKGSIKDLIGTDQELAPLGKSYDDVVEFKRAADDDTIFN